ncbi:2-oxoacid:ferredoxin oxidoreductase subunit beta [Haliangium ochraceum]|uniref:Thiamine pyrophosphate protein domain protein TPP-binding protein n=1 Tax=Haliangium ochraceum (strain DSM 14365 / JCM 11303 / SMP-2) TaxID=502025 RepID=D0LGG6_HALO1|nr:2-oxoacid:ferredoxin oxidoreductase subunit beta [Haliangium ochraceum]ACY12712.1 thiamine pyrophosphate protein domain protein TPP-binding protein [Haliangium ochraceum DSM 14365]
MSASTSNKSGNGKLIKLSKKDFESDQDVRWCPGCGDYAILATVQRALANLKVERENTVFVSGIGCSSRFPYYMNTYGFHSIHGRAPAIATGLKVARPELSVWVITGDGDGLSIGGNHLMHAMRRNVNLNIILFNNQIYGLTKGQYSPTSQVGKKTPTSPLGSVDLPVNPLALATGAGTTFMARVGDTDAKLFLKILERAQAHEGTSLIEVLQNCPVFNDGVWNEVTDRKTMADRQLVLEHGKPLVYGKNKEFGIRMRKDFTPEVVEVGEGKVPESELVVHDETGSPAYTHMLALMNYPEFPIPVGVFRAEPRPSYDSMAVAQVKTAVESQGPADLKALLYSGMTWEVSPDGIKH